jgi:hypothetical protein
MPRSSVPRHAQTYKIDEFFFYACYASAVARVTHTLSYRLPAVACGYDFRRGPSARGSD